MKAIDTRPLFGRCKLGKSRWFWIVWLSCEVMFNDDDPLHGEAASEEDAIRDASLVTPGETWRHMPARWAASFHRKLCQRRRAAKPPSESTAAQPQEFLYWDWLSEEEWWNDGTHFKSAWHSDAHLVRKKTAKKVFVEEQGYDRPRGSDAISTYAVDRAELEAKGEVWCKPMRDRFYTTPCEQRRQTRQASPELSALGLPAGATMHDIKAAYRRLCLATHPDRGGDPEKFKEVQRAYASLASKEEAVA